jgi:hypothetical protein
MSPDPTIEKIKKLLRLGQSNNRHEAELALQRAFEIAERNNIDLAALDLADDLKRIALRAYHVGSRISYTRKAALRIVGTFFNVTLVVGRPCIKFVGTAADVEIAIHVFEFIARCCNRDLLAARKHAARRRFSRNQMLNFVNGFFYGVGGQLRHAREEVLIAHEQYALVLQSEEKRREAFIDANMKTRPLHLLETGRKNVDVLMLGHSYGSQIQINSPLPRATAPLALTAGVA